MKWYCSGYPSIVIPYRCCSLGDNDHRFPQNTCQLSRYRTLALPTFPTSPSTFHTPASPSVFLLLTTYVAAVPPPCAEPYHPSLPRDQTSVVPEKGSCQAGFAADVQFPAVRLVRQQGDCTATVDRASLQVVQLAYGQLCHQVPANGERSDLTCGESVPSE